MAVDVITTLISVIASPTIQSLVKSAMNMLADQLSSNAPLTSTEAQTPKLTGLDRRISMGLTKRDGKIAVALLVEKSESLAERKADDLAKRFGDAIFPMVTGLAHSSRVDQSSKDTFERQLGASIGHIRGTPGSVGCLVKVKTRAGSKDYVSLTSAAHVLSMLNNANKHDVIICPGHPDGPKVLDSKVGLWRISLF